MNEVAFKYTFPISKAEERADGLYLVGEASGPEVDAEFERMTPEAIDLFAKQINGVDKKLAYKDSHAKDGVLVELGEITRAWVTEKVHLGIEVRLDKANPAAVYLWQKSASGKQYGMSVAGRVLDYVDEFVSEIGRVVRTYKHVVLDEISNTTRPAWTPSFGSVLAKSVDEARAESVIAEGANRPMDDLNKGEQEIVPAAEDETEKCAEEVEDQEPAEKAADDEATVERSVEDDSAAGESADTEDATEGSVERSADDSDDLEEEIDKAITLRDGHVRAMVAIHRAYNKLMDSMGVYPNSGAEAPQPRKSDSEENEPDLVKSLTDERTALSAQIEELEKTLAERNRRIEELENSPASEPPFVIERSDPGTELHNMRKDMSPQDQLRLAFALHTQGR